MIAEINTDSIKTRYKENLIFSRLAITHSCFKYLRKTSNLVEIKLKFLISNLV